MNLAGFILPAASIGLGSLLIKPKRGFSIPSADGVGPPEILIPQATLEERHHDELEITEHPVEQGAAISDHAYKRPSTIAIRCGWSNSPSKSGGLLGQAIGLAGTQSSVIAAASAALPTLRGVQSLLSGNGIDQVRDIYAKLRRIQVSRIPFDVFTGKCSYKSMLIKSLSTETVSASENSMVVTIICQQVIIVTTQLFSVSSNPDVQTTPEVTAPVESLGQKSLTPGNPAETSITLSGSAEALNVSVSTVQSMFSQLPDGLNSLTGAVAGAVNQLPGAMAAAGTALTSAIETFAAPLEIPLSSAAQTFSINMEGASISEAVRALPATLEQTQSIVAHAMTELPGVLSQLPSALSTLPSALSTMQAQIQGTLKSVADAVARARIGGGP